MTEVMMTLLEAGVLRPLDCYFARAIVRLAEEDNDDVLLAAALASWAVAQGHVCADLAQLGVDGFVGKDEQVVKVKLPERKNWLATLTASPLVATDAYAARPLYLDPQGRVYLQRYAAYQQSVAKAIRQRAVAVDGYDLEDRLAEILAKLFVGFDDQQRRAAECATRHRFCLISGGPGTGKTTTVVRVLATLQQVAMATGAPLKMVMVAPTGKAAERLGETVTRQLPTLDCPKEVIANLPTKASTIHRLLGYQPQKPDVFRHGPANRLPLDVLLVDEVSMVDLVLMAKLFAALEERTRVIFLGDKDQLASVQLGAIVGDIYAAAAEGPLEPCVVNLTQSHRYSASSDIGRLARAINEGDSVTALEVCRANDEDEQAAVRLYARSEQLELDDRLGELVLAGFSGLWESRDPLRRLAVLNRFRVLCVNRKGHLGVEQMNRRIQAYLARQLGLQEGAEFKDGRPFMIQQNDYRMRLFNGDIGVCCRDDSGAFGVYFQTAEGLRRVPLAQLPRHESVFAMTVHKSQGSEMDHVALVLPRPESPLASRELIYTAVTRAKERVSILGDERALQGAVKRRVQRSSGLVELLQSS